MDYFKFLSLRFIKVSMAFIGLTSLFKYCNGNIVPINRKRLKNKSPNWHIQIIPDKNDYIFLHMYIEKKNECLVEKKLQRVICNGKN